MTPGLMRKVVLVGKLASLAVALAAAGCNDDLKDRTFRLDFPITREQTRAIAGRPELGVAWQSIVFAEPLRFRRVGETIEAFGYEALTLADLGEAHAGKFAMRATLRKGYTGGPAGFATEYVVGVEDVRLVGNLVPPPAPPGMRGIVPGEVVIRPIPEGGIRRVDDRYLIELPAKTSVHISFDPEPNEYEFKVIIAKDGTTLPLRHVRYSELFETESAGTHELHVMPAEASPSKEPDRYSFYVVWGEASIGATALPGEEIHWRSVSGVPASSAR
jgi:hypothetical protein